MTGEVICLGEIMLRLAPSGYLRFNQAHSFEAVYGGGEANVAVSLANFGLPAVFVSKLPQNPIGQAAINSLRQYGVDTSRIVRGGERIGIYFLEKGVSQRASKVIYDRAHSAISEAHPSEFDWEGIFQNASWFHFTGIMPAISAQAAALTLEACKYAKSAGIKISCDLNYRKNLWTESEALKVMSALMEYVDVCIANEEDADKVFGIRPPRTNIEKGMLDREAYRNVAEQLARRFDFSTVAITLRESVSASDNNWSAMLYIDGQSFFSKVYPIHIVDRVGAGDSFAAGLIYSIISGFNPTNAIEFATAASCLKHTIEGDFNHAAVSEIKNLITGGGTGRIQR